MAALWSDGAVGIIESSWVGVKGRVALGTTRLVRAAHNQASSSLLGGLPAKCHQTVTFNNPRCFALASRLLEIEFNSRCRHHVTILIEMWCVTSPVLS